MEMPSFVYWLSVIFATYGVAHILVWEDGPYDILSKLRYFAGVRYSGEDRYSKNGIGGVFNCQICMSVWVAFPIAWLCSLHTVIACGLAAIGFVCILIDFWNNTNDK